jgi:hypothetical protein
MVEHDEYRPRKCSVKRGKFDFVKERNRAQAERGSISFCALNFMALLIWLRAESGGLKTAPEKFASHRGCLKITASMMRNEQMM